MGSVVPSHRSIASRTRCTDYIFITFAASRVAKKSIKVHLMLIADTQLQKGSFAS